MKPAGPTIASLHEALRARALVDPALRALAARPERLACERGVLREVVLLELVEARATARREVPRSRYEKLRALPEVPDASVLALPPRHAWEPAVVSARVAGDEAPRVCSACGGRRPARCRGCHGAGSVACTCSRAARRTCATCRGTGRKPCISCGRVGFLGCLPCGGEGVVHAVLVASAERRVERRSAALGAPWPVERPDDEDLADHWECELDARGERLDADALGPALEASPRGYRDGPGALPSLGADARAALRGLLAEGARAERAGERCAQRVLVRSCAYAVGRYRGYALWVLGARRHVVERGSLAKTRPARSASLVLGAGVASAALTWWLTQR